MDEIETPSTYLFTSVHMGPYLTIKSLETELRPEKVSYLVEGVSKEERARTGLDYLDLGQVTQRSDNLPNLLKRMGIKAVIRSTSEAVTEPNVEAAAALAAREVGVPVFVIEDFPGNYWRKVSERIDALFVEDASLIELHQSRGVDPLIIHNNGNPRYVPLGDHYKKELTSRVRAQLGLGEEKVVLWAGQPHNDDSYQALMRLVKKFPNRQFTLLFRAHPRDTSYSEGKYARLLADAEITFLDVTANNNVLGLYCASDLVITQFSSAGVEASYMGVPTLYVLFNDLAKRYLMTNKGYDSLPWWQAGCAFVIEEENEIEDVLDSAIFDEQSRKAVCCNFQNRFVSNKNSARTIAAHIRSAVA